MNEPIKNPNHIPESYSPDKPEIVNLVKLKTQNLVTTPNGKYIDGVPPLKWEWQQCCTYSGCMTLLLNSMGVNVSYERVMGVVGSCYRVSMAYGWDPASNIVDISYAYLGIKSSDNIGHVYGIKPEVMHEDSSGKTSVSEANENRVKNSIDAGIPVMCLGARLLPEWGIILGYENTPDGRKYFGRSYFDDNAPENEKYTENRYVLANRFPNVEYVKIYNQPCEAISELNTLKNSLQTCIDMFKPHDNLGYNAYNKMIYELKNNTFTADFVAPDVCTIIATLTDARRAAYIYLNQNTGLLSGENKKRLMKISSLYKDMCDILAKIEYEGSEQKRLELVGVLQQCAEIERQVQSVVADILKNWEDLK